MVGSLRIPNTFRTKDASSRRTLARKLTAIAVDEEPLDVAGNDQLGELKERVENHPVHSCPDRGRHLHFAEHAVRLEKEVRGITRRISRRTGTLARRFEVVVDVLEDLGYVSDWNLEPKGELLTGVYNESDLLVVECLKEGVLDGLDGPEVAAVCSSLVYETRGPDPVAPPSWPTDAARSAWNRLIDLYTRIERHEHARGIELTREPDPGFSEKAYRWTAGAPLDRVLEEEDAPETSCARSSSWSTSSDNSNRSLRAVIYVEPSSRPSRGCTEESSPIHPSRSEWANSRASSSTGAGRCRDGPRSISKTCGASRPNISTRTIPTT